MENGGNYPSEGSDCQQISMELRSSQASYIDNLLMNDSVVIKMETVQNYFRTQGVI